MRAVNIKVYGADWCHDTQATRRWLDQMELKYEYLDVDRDPGADAWVREHNGGKQKLPTVDVGGAILSVPDDEELEEAIRGQEA